MNRHKVCLESIRHRWQGSHDSCLAACHRIFVLNLCLLAFCHSCLKHHCLPILEQETCLKATDREGFRIGQLEEHLHRVQRFVLENLSDLEVCEPLRNLHIERHPFLRQRLLSFCVDNLEWAVVCDSVSSSSRGDSLLELSLDLSAFYCV